MITITLHSIVVTIITRKIRLWIKKNSPWASTRRWPKHLCRRPAGTPEAADYRRRGSQLGPPCTAPRPWRRHPSPTDTAPTPTAWSPGGRVLEMGRGNGEMLLFCIGFLTCCSGLPLTVFPLALNGWFPNFRSPWPTFGISIYSSALQNYVMTINMTRNLKITVLDSAMDGICEWVKLDHIF